MSDTLWTVSDYDTHAILRRPDGTPAVRFDVIADAYKMAARLNKPATPTTPQTMTLSPAEFTAAIPA